MRFDLKSDGIAIADIDNSGVLSRALEDLRTLSREAPQMYFRALVTAVLAPHHAEDAEFCQS